MRKYFFTHTHIYYNNYDSYIIVPSWFVQCACPEYTKFDSIYYYAVIFLRDDPLVSYTIAYG